LIALGSGIVVAFIGLVVPPLRFLYNYAWFVGFHVAFVMTLALARSAAADPAAGQAAPVLGGASGA
jgi:NCS1 family nucleobase:cation symporter-1